METKHDKVTEKDYLDLLDIATEVGEEEDNQLFQWVRPLHLDDEDGNLVITTQKVLFDSL